MTASSAMADSRLRTARALRLRRMALALAALVILGIGEFAWARLHEGRLAPATAPWSIHFESSFGPVERPAGVAFAPDGTLYVVDAERGIVHSFTRDGALGRTLGIEVDEPEEAPGRLTNPIGVALDERGTAYVSDLDAGRISMFIEGRFAGEFASDALVAAGSRPGMLAASLRGVLVCDVARHRVLLLGWDGALLQSFEPPSDDELSYPNGVWPSPDGRVYVSDTNHDRIVVFSSDGEFLGTVTRGVVNPRGLVGDGRGRLFVASTLADRVVVLDATSGRELAVLGSAQGQALGFPTGVAYQGGRLVVTDRAASGVRAWRVTGGDGGTR